MFEVIGYSRFMTAKTYNADNGEGLPYSPRWGLHMELELN